MADDLTKMDRWNSEPLDVHTWSDHPEIKTLCDDLYDLAGMTTLEPKGNRKAKRTVKESLRVLILDLYVGGFHREVQHALFKPDLNLFAKV